MEKCPCSFFPFYYPSPRWKRWGCIDGFQGRIFVLFLLTLPQMRNRYCYFKTSPYLNLLLPSPRLICRSVAKGFSLMTLLGRRSEPRHISPFQFPLFSLPSFLSISLYPQPCLIFLSVFPRCPPSPNNIANTTRALELQCLLM